MIDGHTADVVLAAANTEAGISLLAVAADVRGFDARHSPPSTAPARSLGWTSTARVRLIGNDGGAADFWRARLTSRSSRWPPNRSARRNAASTWPSTTPRNESSSVGHRQLPSDQASVRGHAGSGGGRAFGSGPCGRHGRHRWADHRARSPKMVCSEAFLHVARQHAHPRRHRLHLGTRCPPVRPARQVTS